MTNMLVAAQKTVYTDRFVHLLASAFGEVDFCNSTPQLIKLLEAKHYNILIAAVENMANVAAITHYKHASKHLSSIVLLVPPTFKEHALYPMADEFIHSSLPWNKIEQSIGACIDSLQHLSKEAKQVTAPHVNMDLLSRDREIFSLYVDLTKKKSEIQSIYNYLLRKEGDAEIQLNELKRRVELFVKNEKTELPVFSYFDHTIIELPQELNRLRPNEKKHCTLIKMGYENKAIASLLMVSPDTVKKAHLRIKNKIGLPTSTSLRTFILGL